MEDGRRHRFMIFGLSLACLVMLSIAWTVTVKTSASAERPDRELRRSDHEHEDTPQTPEVDGTPSVSVEPCPPPAAEGETACVLLGPPTGEVAPVGP